MTYKTPFVDAFDHMEEWDRPTLRDLLGFDIAVAKTQVLDKINVKAWPNLPSGLEPEMENVFRACFAAHHLGMGTKELLNMSLDLMQSRLGDDKLSLDKRARIMREQSIKMIEGITDPYF